MNILRAYDGKNAHNQSTIYECTFRNCCFVTVYENCFSVRHIRCYVVRLRGCVCVCKYIISFQMHQIRCELKFKSTEIYKEYNRSSSEVCWERERGGERNSFPLHCCNCINCNDLYAKKKAIHFKAVCIFSVYASDFEEKYSIFNWAWDGHNTLLITMEMYRIRNRNATTERAKEEKLDFCSKCFFVFFFSFQIEMVICFEITRKLEFKWYYITRPYHQTRRSFAYFLPFNPYTLVQIQ